METKTYSHQFQMKTTCPDFSGLIIFPALISIGLLAVRIIYSGSPLFIFFVWNLFLALIPFYLSIKIISTSEKKTTNGVNWLLLFIWLLFLPNAPYMITDLIHLKNRTGVPLWYESIRLDYPRLELCINHLNKV